MLDDFRYRLKALFRRRSLERELDDEVAFHLEQHAALEERAGVAREQARRSARLAFGSVDGAKEQSRDGRGVRPLEIAWRDCRYALRTLARTPSFTLVAVLSLTLGIGANTAMFQLLNALVLRPVPVVAAPDELVEVNLPERDLTAIRGNTPRWPALTFPLWEALRDRQQAFTAMFAWADDRFNLAPAGEARSAQGLWVTGGYFHTLGLTPAAGRLFTAADDRPGCGLPGAVVSHDFWMRELRGDPRAIGRPVSVDGTPIDVIGVAPAGFDGLQIGQRFDVALPVCSLPSIRPGSTRLTSGTEWWITATGRLKPGWTLERAQAHLSALAPSLFAASLPPRLAGADAQAYRGATLIATASGTGRSDLRAVYATPLRLLLAMTAFVLLIACANLTNLMLARGAVRRRELSLRQALGASRGRLVSQLLWESVVIAGIGALAGALAAQVISQGLVRLIGSGRTPIVLAVTPDWRVLAFTAGTAFATCLLLGLTPALRGSRGAPVDALKAGARGVAGDRDGLALRRTLVAAQVAVSLVLLVGALLFARSFRNLLAEPLGFDPRGVLLVDVDQAGPAPSVEAAAERKRQIIAGLRAMPGVEAVGETFVLPIAGNNSSSRIWLDGGDPTQARESSFNRISAGYFDALRMRVLTGRDISDQDTATSPKVAVVNETWVRTFSPDASPIGRRFHLAVSTPGTDHTYQVVGIVNDAKYRRLRDTTPWPVAFVPIVQRGGSANSGRYLVRSATAPSSFTPALRETLARVDGSLRFAVRSFEDDIEDATRRDRVMATLSSLFGLLAAVLAAVGLHGVVAYAVERRRREIGIRIALGAGRTAILTSILRESAGAVGAGLAVGVMLSLAVTGAARSLLFGLGPRDAATLAAAVFGLTGIAVVATLMPARRAARIDPIRTLKED
jgi:putative ABC transport system permease protein